MKKTTLLCRLLAVALLTPAVSAYAQLHVPNPLIKPADATKTSASPNGVVPPGGPGVTGGTNNAGRGLPPPPPPGMSSSSDSSSASTRELGSNKDLREFFAGYYVSAIVDNQAVLRRISTSRLSNGTGGSASGGQSGSSSNQSIDAYAFARTDSIFVVDGHEVEGITDNVPLVAKIKGGLVTITAKRDGQSGGTGVFFGRLEVPNNPNAATTQIVLEKPEAIKTNQNKSSSSTPAQ